MNYISDYLDNLLDDKRADMVFPSFQNVQVQDPISKLIKWLNTDRGVGIKIKSEEDILIEDFLPANNSQIIQLNLDNNKKDDNVVDADFIFAGTASRTSALVDSNNISRTGNANCAKVIWFYSRTSRYFKKSDGEEKN